MLLKHKCAVVALWVDQTTEKDTVQARTYRWKVHHLMGVVMDNRKHLYVVCESVFVLVVDVMGTEIGTGMRAVLM